MIDIVKNLGELVELELNNITSSLTKQILFKLIQNAKSLQQSFYSLRGRSEVHFRFDGDLFRKMVKLVDERQNKTHLKIGFKKNKVVIDIPVDLVTANKDSVTIFTREVKWCKYEFKNIDTNVYEYVL